MRQIRIYQTKENTLKGTDFHEVRKKAFALYREIKKKSKRRPYIRSAYFNKEKIFLDIFWSHLFEKKHFADLIRRIRLYPCAIEIIKKSNFVPSSKENPNKKSEILHRFSGKTINQEIFFVQIKEDKRSGKKWLISVFPARKKTFR